jgi:hypothetical protein
MLGGRTAIHPGADPHEHQLARSRPVSSLCLLAGLAIMESESGVSFIFLNACSAEIALGPLKQEVLLLLFF